MTEEKIGILSYGLYLPQAEETAQAIAERAGIRVEDVLALGIEKKPCPSSGDQPVVMGVHAAMAALRSAGMDPSKVDLVIWTGEEYKDYVAQTAAIRVQEEAGCKNAWAFDLVGQGVTFIQGLRVAADIIETDQEVNTVLLAGGTRNVDLVDYENPHTRFLLSCSVSGGALILVRDPFKNRLLRTAFSSDPEMADEVYVPAGGTEHPYTPENIRSELMYYQVRDFERLQHYLETRFPEALIETALKALNGRMPDYLALRHLSPAHQRKVLAGLSHGRSVSLNRWGHHGTNDPILSLHLGLEEGLVREGDLVLFLTGGIGFQYAAALLQWG